MTFKCVKFSNRHQEHDEPVDTFITVLYTLTEHCGYAVLHDEMLRDRIVVGIQDHRLSEKLQLDPLLTLAEVVKKQQAIVREDKNEKEMLPSECPVQTVHKGRGDIRINRPPFRQSNTPSSKSCPWCADHDHQNCPARNASCHLCSKQGHFQTVCRSAPHASQVHSNESHHDPPSETFLGGVSCQGKPSLWTVTVGVATISEHMHNSIGSPPLSPPTMSLKGPSNYTLPVT